MAGEPKQASSATMALVYITVGALIDVWTTVYFFYLQRQGVTGNQYLWCGGLFFTGLVLMGIGLLVGKIGRSAREAEVAASPTQVVMPTGTVAQATVPGNAPVAPSAPVRAMPADGLVAGRTRLSVH